MTISSYTRDLLYELKQKAIEARRSKEAGVDTEDYQYRLGYLMAYYEVISLALEQARAFKVDIEELGLNGIDPDKDLL